ncbi:intraflagellar transport protein 27 homolog [Misgurnus anguillicaudatus]|uniref:intraflagellar transport protein 27 homolog n=1 Tax=Misgurnus anguillicaudatus TaxID=75329 RepID=UPI002435C1F7|nr:intraflagellar transport protein 27 homolog [Misgurnus anguillicaudatus]
MVKLRARCVVVGDAAVGKTSLCHMFRSDGAVFQKNYSMTVGVELMEKSVSIPDTSDSVEFYIYDSAGRELFADACENVWGQPSVICVVFDITSEASFTSCSRWVERVQSHCNGLQVPGVLVGNKCDLSSRREVETSEAQTWAQTHGLQYHETSAKEIGQFEAPFLSLAQMFYSHYQDQIQTTKSLL